MKFHFRVLVVSVRYSYPTNHMMQIKMDFYCFDYSTEICLFVQHYKYMCDYYVLYMSPLHVKIIQESHCYLPHP